MIFSFIFSFLIATLSGMGVGGGGLFVVFLAVFTQMDQLTIQGINLLFFLFSSGSAVCIHLSKRQIFGSAVIAMAIFGIFGAVAGSLLGNFLPASLLRKLFGVMLTVSGILSLKSSINGKERKEIRR